VWKYETQYKALKPHAVQKLLLVSVGFYFSLLWISLGLKSHSRKTWLSRMYTKQLECRPSTVVMIYGSAAEAGRRKKA
jgi:hypothetical protein